MLSKDKVVKLYEDSPSHLHHKVRNKCKKTFKHINENFRGDTFSEKACQYVHDKRERKCERCGDPCSFRSFREGFSAFCSSKCRARSQSEDKNGRKCEVCGGVFTVTARNENRKNQFWCSDGCLKEWLSDVDAEEKSRELSEVERELREANQPYFRAWELNPEAAAATEFGVEGGSFAEKLRSVLHPEEKVCARGRCSEPCSLVSFPQGFNTFCSQKCKRASEAEDRCLETFQQMVQGDRLPEHIEPLFGESEYNGNDKKYEFLCQKCGSQFEGSIRNGSVPVCRNCNPRNTSTSRHEDLIESWLSSHASVVRGNRSVLGGKELDLLLPEHGVAVEVNGLFWHSELGGGKGRSYHTGKTEACESEGIKLVHVFGDEIRNKPEVVKSRLKHELGISEQTVGARECEAVEVEPGRKNEFLNANHLQGQDRSNVKLGLESGKELVAIATFTRPRLALNQTEGWEISRFCTRSGWHVHGGFGKLLAEFRRLKNPDKIVSFADRRWTSTTESSVYDALGFELANKTDPNYWYLTTNYKERKHRFGFRRSVLPEKLDSFDPDLSEWENMQKAGRDRIWDCGNMKYVLNLT